MCVSQDGVEQAISLAERSQADESPNKSKQSTVSSHRYRIIELLDITAASLGQAGVWDSPEVIASMRIRWEAVYRVSEEDWAMIMQSIDDYRGPKIRKDVHNLRHFFEAVMWVADTGARWSDLPKSYGRWRRIYVRFGRWSALDYWKDIVPCLSDKDQQSALILLIDNHQAMQRAQLLLSVLSCDMAIGADDSAAKAKSLQTVDDD